MFTIKKKKEEQVWMMLENVLEFPLMLYWELMQNGKMLVPKKGEKEVDSH